MILNLAVNARDAMPQGGKLSVKTCNVSIDPAEAAKRPPMSPGQYTLLTVTDTGHGMDEATLKRATEPFFGSRRGHHHEWLPMETNHRLGVG